MNERQSPNLLMLATRAAVPGEAKTRLGNAIGMERAAVLYEAFLRDLAARLVSRHDSYDVGWTYSPPDIDFRPWLERAGASYSGPGEHLIPQEGDAWDVRQDNLLRWGDAQGYARVVLAATDSPHLPQSCINQAFRALEAHDVVLGRVHDGGYYLVGMAGYFDVLRHVPMSTSSAADALVARAQSMGLSVAELASTFDIDIEDDLIRLVRELSPDGGNSPETWAALDRLGLIPSEFAGRS